MTRNYLAVLTAMAAVAFVSVVAGTGCQSTGVGDPCVPEQEYETDFMGFDYREVNVESKSFQCQTRLCLVNHFQGRVSCPYGQNAGATAANQSMSSSNAAFTCDGKNGSATNSTPCCTPGVPQSVNSDQDCPPGGACKSTITQSAVPAQCTARTADKAVYCSCRCANPSGKTDDGANYCTCPSGFACTQLIEGVGIGLPELVGAYCVKNNTQYDPTRACSPCDPGASKGQDGYCGPVNTTE